MTTQSKPSHVIVEADILDAALEAIKRVRELHKPESGQDRPTCSACHQADAKHWDWPCNTIQALDGE